MYDMASRWGHWERQGVAKSPCLDGGTAMKLIVASSKWYHIIKIACAGWFLTGHINSNASFGNVVARTVQSMPTCHYVTKAGSMRCKYCVISTCALILAQCLEVGNQQFWGVTQDVFYLFSFVLFFLYTWNLDEFFLLCGNKFSSTAPNPAAKQNLIKTKRLHRCLTHNNTPGALPPIEQTTTPTMIPLDKLMPRATRWSTQVIKTHTSPMMTFTPLPGGVQASARLVS